jgi:hypothetical protein
MNIAKRVSSLTALGGCQNNKFTDSIFKVKKKCFSNTIFTWLLFVKNKLLRVSISSIKLIMKGSSAGCRAKELCTILILWCTIY